MALKGKEKATRGSAQGFVGKKKMEEKLEGKFSYRIIITSPRSKDKSFYIKSACQVSNTKTWVMERKGLQQSTLL